MNTILPPIPAWDGLHPLIIHFPIALLLVAPALVLAALLWRAQSRTLLTTAFALMFVGTLASWMAVSTGHAAGELAEDGAVAAKAVIERHEELAETTRNLFTGLTLAFGMLVFAPLVMRRPLARMPSTALSLVFLAFYAGGALFLVNTAHQGGRLVHEFGVRAMMSSGQSAGGMVPGQAPGGSATSAEKEPGDRD